MDFYWRKIIKKMKQMKKILITLILIQINIFILKSQPEKLNTFSLTPVIFEENMQHEQVDPRIKNLLKNKMQRIATKYGFSSGIKENRHIIFPDFEVVNKDIVQSIPPKVSVEILITFYIADYDTRTIYTSEEFSLLGVGKNETKAYYRALNQLRTNNPKFEKFIERGKKKIIDFYNTHCDQIINKANTKAKIGKEYLALSILTRIPLDCDVCYNKAMNESVKIYKLVQKKKCNQNIVKAKNIWATDHSYAAAQRIEPYLSEILPDFPCYKEASILVNKIDKYLKEKEKREWDYKINREKREWNRRTKNEDREYSLRNNALEYYHQEKMLRIQKNNDSSQNFVSELLSWFN